MRKCLLFVALSVLFAGAGGCTDHDHENRQKPGGELYQMWSADGERMLVEHSSGELAYKLRRRTAGWKVYGEDLVPVGVVRAGWRGSKLSGDGRGIRVERLESGSVTDLVRREEDVWELPGAFRLERAAEGWAVYDAEAEWIGRFYRAERRWQLDRGRHEESIWRVRREEGRQILKRGGEAVYQVWADREASAVLLALALEELDIVERVAVGAWLQEISRDDENG